MMKRFIYTFAVAGLISITACTGSSKSESDTAAIDSMVTTVEETADLGGYTIVDNKIVPNGDKGMIVDFSAVWCPPCQKLKPEFHALAEELTSSVTMVTVDVDSMPELTNNYDISNIPALIYLDKEGNEVYRSIGYVDSLQIKADIAKYLN